MKRLLADFLAEHGLTGCRSALVGFSGGLDSTALLEMLRASGLAVTAVHFHHGLRGASADADARWCEAFCRQRGLDFILRRLEVPRWQRQGESVETAARRLRLAAWQELSAEHGGCPVFLAHHADDALEELFLRLMRGANATGLTSLRPVRQLGKVMFLRPLLALRKSELQDYLLARGLADWCVDETNQESDYRRNAVRNRLLPLIRELAGTDLGVFQSLSALRLDADFVEDAVLQTAEELDLPGWSRLHPAVLPRYFRRWRRRHGGGDVVPSGAFSKSLWRELQRQTSEERILQVDADTRVRLTSQGLELLLSSEPVSFAGIWRWREQAEFRLPGMCGTLRLAQTGERAAFMEHFAAEALPAELVVRSWQAGDKMIPFGRHSAKKLQDLFVNRHLPAERRHQLPVVCAGGEILWVPEVRRAEFGRVEPHGTSVGFVFIPDEGDKDC